MVAPTVSGLAVPERNGHVVAPVVSCAQSADVVVGGPRSECPSGRPGGVLRPGGVGVGGPGRSSRLRHELRPKWKSDLPLRDIYVIMLC